MDQREDLVMKEVLEEVVATEIRVLSEIPVPPEITEE